MYITMHVYTFESAMILSSNIFTKMDIEQVYLPHDYLLQVTPEIFYFIESVSQCQTMKRTSREVTKTVFPKDITHREGPIYTGTLGSNPQSPNIEACSVPLGQRGFH